MQRGSVLVLTLLIISIEAGARVGLVAFDNITEEYVKNRPFTPKGDEWELALSQWKELRSDHDAHFEEIIYIDGSALKPQVTWGTSPEMVIDVDGEIPEANSESIQHALKYMNLEAGMKISDIK